MWGGNLFVLISGWFGIKKLVLNALHVFLSVLFFGVLIFFYILFRDGSPAFSFSTLLHSIDYNNWFVISYLMLILVAPILEKSLQKSSFEELSSWIILLCIFNVFFGYLLGYVNINGYNVVNFIFLYYIARWLKIFKERNEKVYVSFSNFGLFIWVIFSLLLGLGYLFLNDSSINVSSVKYWAYNNPFVLVLSIGFFVPISMLRIKSKIINWFAAGTFGVFLLHSNPMILEMRNKFASEIYTNYSYIGLFLLTVLILFFLGLLSLPIDKSIRFLCMSVISKKGKNANLSRK